MLVVTLAESTPVHEAERLQADLRRAGIEPFGWVINSSLAAARTTHPTLRARAGAELAHIERVRRRPRSGRGWSAGSPRRRSAPTRCASSPPAAALTRKITLSSRSHAQPVTRAASAPRYEGESS